MKKASTKSRLLLPTLAAALIAGSSARAEVIYADDFNNPGNGNDVGMTKPTTVGGYSWVETGNINGCGTVASRMRFYNQAAIDAAAHVDYSLDGVENYTVTFTLQLYTIQRFGNFVFSPRLEGTTSDAAAAHWSVDTDVNATNPNSGNVDLYFNGVEVAADILQTIDKVYTVSMAVAGNNATLTIFDGTTLIVTDTQFLGSFYNNSIPDYALFGYNVSATSSTGMAAYMDDLSVVTGSDYDDWAGPLGFNLVGGPDDDDDGDGLTNSEEYAFGLNPTSGASNSPILAPLSNTTGLFQYTRRNPAVYNTGLTYSYEYSTTLANGSWMPFTPDVDPPATDSGDPVETVTVDVPDALLGNPQLFVRVREEPLEPVSLLDEDFETSNGGFTVVDHSAGAGTLWTHGDPDSSGIGGTVSTGNGGSAQCWGTDIGNPGLYATGTDCSLISPVIDLTAVPNAVLSFAQAIDILGGDTFVVNIIDDDISSGIDVIEPAVHTSPDLDINQANWETVSGVPITGGRPVRIEWRFSGNNDGTYIGAYIDDVSVFTAAP